MSSASASGILPDHDLKANHKCRHSRADWLKLYRLILCWS
jgi:hypothetical protein